MSFIADLALENHNWVAEIKAYETTDGIQSNTGTSVRLAQFKKNKTKKTECPNGRGEPPFLRLHRVNANRTKVCGSNPS